jgi:D-alanyl-lipoteichoic acid acyltransferase DltB (MBOAT superfamily)
MKYFPDPAAVQFWWFVGLGLVFLVPLGNATARRWVFAGINLSILLLMLRADFTMVLVFIAVAWAVLQNLAGRLGRIWVALGGLATLALFLIYKLPKLGAAFGLDSVNPILLTIGFSYVMLRLFDAGRAIREGRQAPPDLPSTINYLLPFHMLAAGPIQSYDEFVAQPGVPAPLSTRAALMATERIANGLFKKYVLAQGIEALLLTGFHAHGAYTVLEIQLAYIWLYLDFSAYSDLAAGIGRLIGVATPENFNRAYLARNVIDFWERWHISLSMFIRRNVFIPIQLTLMRRTGGRAPLWIASFAFVVSFLLCGLWHGMSWIWVAWGLYQASGLIICNLYRHWLTKRIGRKGVIRYMANPWIRLAATAVTFEFAAIAVAMLTYPSSELSLSWLTSYRQ